MAMNGLGDEGIATQSGSCALEWVKSLPDEADEDRAMNRERRGKVLRKAAYYHNIDVVRILLTADILQSSGKCWSRVAVWFLPAIFCGV